MSKTSKTAAAVAMAWGLLALIALVLVVPVYAACTSAQSVSLRVAVENGISTSAPTNGCCHRLSPRVPNTVTQQPSRLRVPQAVASGYLSNLYPKANRVTPLGEPLTTPPSLLQIYALTQRLRL